MRGNADVARIVGPAGIVLLALAGGCASELKFPTPMELRVENGVTIVAFDTDGDKHADYWQYQGSDGRKHALAYAEPITGEPGPRIELDAPDADAGPHFVIVLDGVPFELVEELYHEGHFRLFHPPRRVVCCFPSMTDLALAELLHAGPCLAYEAQYFDRGANRLSDGSAVYLGGKNSPWLEDMDYRCSLWWDVKVYLDPQAVFEHEVNGILRAFRGIDAGEGWAYSVGTAGIGTRRGREGILEYLRTIDRLCEQIVFERRGRVRITLTADHGHNLVVNRRIKFDDALRQAGYRPRKSIRAARDVVAIAYGLVTYAAFYASDPAGVAECLARHEDVEFACYPAGDAIVVCDREGRARITACSAGLAYDSSAGDPLRLAAIIEQLQRDGCVSADGEIDGRALFDATVEHEYPDPLARIWRAFHGLVEHPPDVIVNLRDGACHGSGFFRAMIGEVTSTHGSLNRMSSTTFVLTMLGELPAVLPTRELRPALAELRGE